MAVPSFLIKNGSTDFLNKQKNLFDLLESAEKETQNTQITPIESMEIDERRSNKHKRKKTKQFRGKESLFKEPVDLPLRFKKTYKMPDFQRNPHKWVKYSLADITQNDMSNESNTAAALSFLENLKTQKQLKTIQMELDDVDDIKESHSNLHQFNVPIKQETKASNEPVVIIDRKDNSKPVFKSSKLIMPEYVIGQKKENKSKKAKAPVEKGKEIYLNHIHEYEDE